MSEEEILKRFANELEQIVLGANNDERHDLPDPCLVCEVLDAVHAVVERMRNIEIL